MSAEKAAQQIEKPKFTAKGEPTFNFTKTPNGLVDDLIAKGKLALGLEAWLVLIIERNTWGAEGKPEYARMTQSEFAKKCGGKSEQAVADALRRLEKAGIITVIPKGGLRVVGEKRGYRLAPERWHLVKRYRDPADAENEEAEKKPDPKVEHTQSEPVLLRPNAKSRLIPIRITLEGKPEFDLPVRFRNEVDLSLAFVPVQTAKGLEVTVRRGGVERRTKSESDPTRVGKGLSQAVEKKQSPELLSLVVDDYRKYFLPVFLRELKKPLEESFLRQLAAAAQYAPVTDFDQKLNDLRRRKLLSSGMILKITSEDIGPAWAIRKRERESHEAAAARVSDRLPLAHLISERLGETLADFRRITGNPKAEVEEWIAAGDALMRDLTKEGSHHA
jgi:DNA-binding PadR family transcriptional regulator